MDTTTTTVDNNNDAQILSVQVKNNTTDDLVEMVYVRETTKLLVLKDAEGIQHRFRKVDGTKSDAKPSKSPFTILPNSLNSLLNTLNNTDSTVDSEESFPSVVLEDEDTGLTYSQF